MNNENYKEKIDLKITYDEYQTIRKECNYKFWKTFFIGTIIIILFFSLTLIPPDPVPIDEVIIVDIFVIVILFFILKVKDCLFLRYDYNSLAKYKDKLEYNIIFYDKYIKIESENTSLKIDYKQIKKIKLTSTHLYIIINIKEIIPIPKYKINNNLISFLNKKQISKITRKEEQIDNNQVTKSYEGVRIFLIILFILTILSLWISLALIAIVSEQRNLPNFLSLNNTWVAYFVLPIPIVSIILGIIYIKKGVKCAKNIVAGVIVGSFLLLIGLSSNLINFEVDYKTIRPYQPMIGVEIPTTGTYHQIIWDTSYLTQHISNYVIFKEKDAKNFYQNIKNTDFWITEEQVSSKLGTLLYPVACESTDQECYYSVYLEELNAHNTLPAQTGIYHVYAMSYSPDKAYLDIEEYIYNYKE